MGGEFGQQFRAASIAGPLTPPHSTASVSEHIRRLTRGPLLCISVLCWENSGALLCFGS